MMSNILTVGLFCEGTTDERFLLSVISRTFEEVALECSAQLEIYDPVPIVVDGDGFMVEVVAAATAAHEQGIMVLCVHTDADAPTDRDAFQFKINPAFVAATGPGRCKVLITLVPVRMTEAWMLADPELLQDEIGLPSGTVFSTQRPEAIANPKETITSVRRWPNGLAGSVTNLELKIYTSQ